MTRTAAIMASYDHGASDQPLLGETIGENFNRMAMTHADREALVDRFGVPDARLGEEIMAWIRLRPGAPTMTAADVREFADGKLARYKIPRYVRIVEDFPMTASGKVRKVEMREAAVSMLGLTDIAAPQYA